MPANYTVPIATTSDGHNSNVNDDENSSLWPSWMEGMPLGLYCDVARIQQQTIKAFYPERFEILNSLDFPWWIEPGPHVPEKYYCDLTV